MRKLLFIGILATGCSSLKSTSNKPTPDPVYQKYVSMTVPDTCPAENGEAACGLISQEPANSFGEYQKVLCPHMKEDACRKGHTEMMLAKYQLRYKQADWQQVTLWCKAEPIKCGDAKQFEGQILSLHNEAVAEMYKKETSAIAEKKEEAIAERRRLNAQRRSNCTSLPNGAGGFYTNCY